MDKIVETYNPYNQNVERRSSQLPGYINETFINSVEVRSPFIAGNKGYIGGTLQVGQEGIIMNGDTRTISSTNFIDNVSGWNINGDGNAQFNNITARGTFILSSGETVEDAINNIPDPTWTNLEGKPSVLALAALNNPTPSGSGLFISNTHLGYYDGGNWKTFMKNDGTFGLSGSGSNSLAWNGTTLTITGNIVGSNITGGTLSTVGIGGHNFVEIRDNRIYIDSFTGGSGTLSSIGPGGPNGLGGIEFSGNTFYNGNMNVLNGNLLSFHDSGNTYRGRLYGSQFTTTGVLAITLDGIRSDGNIFTSYGIACNNGFWTNATSYTGNIVPYSTSSGASLGNSSNRWGTVYSSSINTNKTSTMFDIMPYNTSSWLGSSLNPWPRIYTNDLIAPNATINIYGFKINTANYFSGAPGGSPIGRIQFQLSNGNVYVLPVYNP